MSFAIDFISNTPTELRGIILRCLDNKSLNSKKLVSKTWRIFVRDIWPEREKELNSRIDRWMYDFWGHLCPTLFQNDPLVSEIMKEISIKEKQKKFSNLLNYCEILKVQRYIDSMDPFFRACVNEYLRIRPSHVIYYKLTYTDSN